jgi:acyl-CoA thioester hydrolase
MTDAPRIITFPFHIRVRYADTDQMGIVYNGKYLEYFEVGRTELFRSLGLSYSEFESLGYRLPLVQAHCDYLQPARYDDLLVVQSQVADTPQPRLRIDYEIRRDGEAQLLVRGHTVHAFVRTETGRPVRPPSIFSTTLRSSSE